MSCVPRQYVARANEAMAIMSIEKGDAEQIAKSIALAELVQISVFVIFAVVFALAYFKVISPQVAGIISLALLPIKAIASYRTFAHYKSISRIIMTVASVCTLAACSVLALFGTVYDSSFTLCLGGITLHLFRNISDYFDVKKASDSYKRKFLDQKHNFEESSSYG